MRFEKTLIYTILAMMILYSVVSYSEFGAPAEFGNLTNTTCWIGGDLGELRCLGDMEIATLNITDTDVYGDLMIYGDLWLGDFFDGNCEDIGQVVGYIDEWGTFHCFDVSIYNDSGLINSTFSNIPANCSSNYAIIGFENNFSTTYCQEFTTPSNLTDTLANYNTSAEISGAYVPYTGATKNVDLGAHNFTVDTDVLYVDKNNDRVGIGIVKPETALHVSVDGNTPHASTFEATNAILLSNQGTAARMGLLTVGGGAWERPILVFYKAEGTMSSPTAPSENMRIGSLLADTYDGDQMLPTGSVDFYVDGAVSNNVCPTRISFSTGETNSRTERMIIKSDGKVGIGTDSPDEELDVEGDIVVTGANPTYRLYESASKRAGVQWNNANDYLNIFSVGGPISLNPDGGVGIGTAAASPTYALDVVGDIGLDDRIYHNDDSDTYIQFNNNQIINYIGGVEFIRRSSIFGENVYSINEGGVDMDFKVESNNDANAFFINGGTDKVGIGTSTPSSKLGVVGAISSSAATLTASSDNYSVSGINTLFIAPAAAPVILGGLTGGVTGQVLYVAITGIAFTTTVENVEGVGDQDIYLCDESDDTLDDYGGWTFACDGTNWYDLSHAKHI